MRILVAVLAIAVSTPVISIPTSPEAQTMGRNNMRQARPRVTREDRLTNLRYEAEDRLLEIETRISEIQDASQGGTVLTAGQQRENRDQGSGHTRAARGGHGGTAFSARSRVSPHTRRASPPP